MSDQKDSAPPPPQSPPLPASPKKKEGMSTGCIVTLVIGIVGFVLLFLFPIEAFPHITKGRRLQAKAQMKGLELAVKAYQTEYNRLPALEDPPPSKDNTEGYDTTSKQGRGLIDILTGTDNSKNPRQVPFYEPPAAKKNGGGYTTTGGLVDIWGTKGYMIVLDYDGDGLITDPEHPGDAIGASVIVYSAGPDLDYTTWKDNVKCWD